MLALRNTTLLRALGVTRRHESTVATVAVLRGHGQGNLSRRTNSGQLTPRTQTRFLTRGIESRKKGVCSSSPLVVNEIF